MAKIARTTKFDTMKDERSRRASRCPQISQKSQKKYFCDICHGCFKLARKILVTFAIFAIIADISGPFLASLLSKSGILLHLLLLRYLSRVFLASKKNPCYFCDNCGHFGALLGFFFF